MDIFDKLMQLEPNNRARLALQLLATVGNGKPLFLLHNVDLTAKLSTTDNGGIPLDFDNVVWQQ